MTHVGKALLCVLLLLLCALRAPAQPSRPNIIHIVADDVGWDDVGPFGGKDIPTPNLDRLARQGMRFTSFYAPGPLCTPTRAALLTGCYAPRVGLPDVLFPYSKTGLADSEVTIAELLKERGYATALVGKWHLGHHQQFLPGRHGFDHFFGIPYPNDHEPVRVQWEKRAGVPDYRPPPMPLYREDKLVEEPADLESLPLRFTQDAVRFLRENRDRPFYLHLANIETHTPNFTAARFRDFSGVGAYGDAVVSLDWTVGEIEAALQNLGLAGNTLVVFTSDNGPLLESVPDLPAVYGRYGTVNTARKHLLRGAKGSVWEGGVRVACLARWPGRIPAGSACHELVAGFDLFATFAALAGAKPPADRVIDGRDITPLLTAEPGAKSPHEAFYYYQGWRLGAVRSGPWKLVFGSGEIPHADERGRELLFNLDADIGESSDVSAAHPEELARLRALAGRAREDLGDAGPDRPGKNRRPPGRAD